MGRQIEVFVVAPKMLCWGFERLMATACADVRVVGSAARIGQAAGGLQRVRADVVVVDYDEVFQPDALRAAGLPRPVLLLAPAREKHHIGHWTGAGVLAMLAKDAPPDLLLDAIRTACGGARPAAGVPGIQLAPRARARARATSDARERSKFETLTLRERQLLFALVCNATTPGKLLAHELCISEHTLRNHLTSVYGKLGVQNRLSLHDFARRHHLADDPGLMAA